MGQPNGENKTTENQGTGQENKEVEKVGAKVEGGSTDDKKTGNDDAGLKSALQKERKQREALEKQIRDGELAKLPELERAQTQARELTEVNEKLTKENMRLKVGMQEGLPWSLAKRLTGDTEDELKADAAELLKSYKVDDNQLVKDDHKNKVKTTNDTNKRGGSAKPDMNTLIRAMRN